MKIIKLCAFLLAGMLLTGCVTATTPLMDNPTSESVDYLLEEGDTVTLMVYGEPDMTMKVLLDESGAISFPYIGKLVLKGKTAEQVSEELTNRLRGDYLQNPMVTVNVTAYRKFYIAGEVANPNGYAWEPGLNVEKSIALAGGYTDRADRKDINIRLSRTNQLLVNVDVRHSVHPGDTVIVGMSFF